MKAFFLSVAFGVLLSVGTGTAYCQQPNEKQLITACNQAAIELEHRRTENVLLDQKVTGLETVGKLQTEQNELLRVQNTLLMKALTDRKVTDDKMLIAIESQRAEIGELKAMYERAQKAEARQRKLKWVFTAVGIAATAFLMK